MSFFKKVMGKVESVVGEGHDKKEHPQGLHEDKQHSLGDNYSQNHANPVGGGTQPYQAHSPPPLPPGWISQWDPASQRYYYLEQATGRTQWDLPVHGSGQPSNPNEHGSFGAYREGTQHALSDTAHTTKESHDKKKDGHGGMMKGAAGGLAVGAAGGLLVGHAMGDNSSDDEDKHHAPYQQPTSGSYTGYQQHEGYGSAAPPAPATHGSASSSDVEELREAREEYENASESDKESAREEYEEQYEETYGSD